MATWMLTDRGRTLEVAEEPVGRVVLTVDGQEVLDRPAAPLATVKLDLGAVDGVQQVVRVDVGLRGSVRRAALVERAAEGGRAVTPFVPPVGSRARRLYDLREGHPRLFAARHVAATIVGFLGISAMISAFFGRLWDRIDWSWLPDLPTLSLPVLSLPDWVRYLNPLYWLRELLSWIASLLPDWNLLGWWPGWELPWLRYVVPLVVALAIAYREVDRRQTRARREAGYQLDRAPTGRSFDAPASQALRAEDSGESDCAEGPDVAPGSGPTGAAPGAGSVAKAGVERGSGRQEGGDADR